MTVNNLCNSCSNIGCEFQSGIVRTKCAFYMPPKIEPDNCGIPKSDYENRLKADMLDMLDKIRAEIDKWHHLTDKAFNDGIDTALEIIDSKIKEYTE